MEGWIVADACQWLAAFAEWDSHQSLLSGIKFRLPVQRHNGSAIAIGQQRAQIYDKAYRANPPRWRRHPLLASTEEVWINKQIEELNPILVISLIEATCAAAEE